MLKRQVQGSIALTLLGWLAVAAGSAPAADGLTVAWQDRMLTIRGAAIPGETLQVWYLEAYCRPGSTDRDWHETVIPHRTELVAAAADGKRIELRDTLDDGVVVTHAILAGKDEVEFQLVAQNPTDQPSQAHWAQPCIRVDRFTGASLDDRMAVVPVYARKCFVFLDGRLARLPTQPWATEARYTPGQTYCPAHVDRNDVNPRPLSRLVPSNGLIGCFSADERSILATAWQPYQELFQGVIACIHSDLRIGGLAPGQTKRIHGRIYLVDADVDALLARYRRDFPEHGR